MSLILNNAQIIINSVDLSQYVDSVTLEEIYTDVDTTTFGSTSKQHQAGLSDNKLTLEFLQDYSAGAVDATIFPLVGGTTTFNVKPIKAATSATNPAYTGVLVVLGWKPLEGKVGDVSKSSVTWPISGAVTRNTT